MATFKTVVQKQRRDGFYLVYIRVTHNRYIGFIKTDKLVNQKGLFKHNEVIDPYVLKSCLEKITDYVDRLNKKEINSWSVKDII